MYSIPAVIIIFGVFSAPSILTEPKSTGVNVWVEGRVHNIFQVKKAFLYWKHLGTTVVKKQCIWVWIRNQLDVTYVLSFISPLQVAQHVSGNHVPIFRSWRLRSVIATCWYCAVAAGRLSEPVIMCIDWGVHSTVVQWIHYLLTGSDSLPAAMAQYQHVAITLQSRQLLKMGTWLPETCWATCKGEIKDNTKVTSSWFLIHTELWCMVNHTLDLMDLSLEYSLTEWSALAVCRSIATNSSRSSASNKVLEVLVLPISW